MPDKNDDVDHAQQMEAFPPFDVDAVEALMRSTDPGGYIIYRTTEQLVVQSNKFTPLCISYKDDSHEILHNIVWFNASAFGGWAPFVGWVTIHPHPWKVQDPRTLLESNQLWPNLDELLSVLPELKTRLDPYTGDPWPTEAGASGVVAVASQAQAREAMAGKAPNSSASGKGEAVSGGTPNMPKPWQGSKDDALVFQLMVLAPLLWLRGGVRAEWTLSGRRREGGM